MKEQKQNKGWWLRDEMYRPKKPEVTGGYETVLYGQKVWVTTYLPKKQRRGKVALPKDDLYWININ